MDGYIKLYRKLLDNPIFQNANLLKVFIWCLLRATFKPRDVLVGLQKVHLKPGQFIYGRLKASDELKIRPSTLNDYIQALKGFQIIDIKSNNKYSIITVTNWAFYQSEEDITDIKTDSQTDTKPTNMRHQDNTNNKGKRMKKERKDIYLTIQHLSISQDEYDKLVNQYGKEDVDKKIEYAKNYRNLKKYVSLYLTLNNWLKADISKKDTHSDKMYGNPFLDRLKGSQKIYE